MRCRFIVVSWRDCRTNVPSTWLDRERALDEARKRLAEGYCVNVLDVHAAQIIFSDTSVADPLEDGKMMA